MLAPMMQTMPHQTDFIAARAGEPVVGMTASFALLVLVLFDLLIISSSGAAH